MGSSENITLIFSGLLVLVYSVVAHALRLAQASLTRLPSQVSFLHESSVAIVLGLVAALVLRSVSQSSSSY